MGKVEEYRVRGILAGLMGVLLYADAIGCGRAYGYDAGNIIEFVLGTLAVLTGVWMFYLAGVLRDRRVREEAARRRAAREQRGRVGR